MDKKILILIDGHALAFRSYFALERTQMKTVNNQPTWAIYGFFKAIFDLLKKNIKPDAIAVAFDVSHQTFRTEMYQEYKANRQIMPDTLRSQLSLIMEGLKAFNIPIYTKAGFEADDVIGTIANKALNHNIKTFILTGDKDSFQLIDKNNNIEVLIPSTGALTTYNWDKVYEKLGVYPNQVVDFKALSGDSSDNIPGIKGIGAKTASSLLSQYENLENIYLNLNNITKKSLKQKLIDGKDIAILSQTLAKIDKTLDIDFDFQQSKLDIPDVKQVIEFFKGLQLYGFVKNINSILNSFNIHNPEEKDLYKNNNPKNNTISNNQLTFDFQKLKNEPDKKTDLVFVSKEDLCSNFNFDSILVDSDEKFNNLLLSLKNQSLLSFSIEVENFQDIDSDIIGLSVGFNNSIKYYKNEILIDQSSCNTNNSRIFYIPLKHKNYSDNIPIEQFISKFKSVFEDNNIAKVFQDSKLALNTLKKYNIDLKNIVLDTMLASYVQDPARRHSLSVQAQDHLDYIIEDLDDILGKGKNSLKFDLIDINKAFKFSSDNAFCILELVKYYNQALDDTDKKILTTIEIPLVYVLSQMELNGVSIDTSYLKELSNLICEKLNTIENNIYQLAGETFNVNSPKKVGEILFEKLGLKPKSKPRSLSHNKFSTNAKILEELAPKNEIVKLILDQRHLNKLKTTYIDTLPLLISKKDNRIHTSFNQTVTTTGRISSSNPNLQNIPIRTELGNKIRRAFTPANKNDSCILSSDYSQIELRLLAHVSQDKNLIDAFNSGQDIHSITASKVFDVSLENVTKQMRQKAKAVNFGIVYGQTKYGLASSLDIPIEDAKIFIDRYFDTYPKVKQYMEDTINFVTEHGYVQTIYGRKRYLANELTSSTRQIKEFALRAAINAPIQGTAADLIKIAMIELKKKFDEYNVFSKLILQVHDELVIEAKKSELDLVKKLVKESMELNQPLLVPLVVDINVNTSWMEE